MTQVHPAARPIAATFSTWSPDQHGGRLTRRRPGPAAMATLALAPALLVVCGDWLTVVQAIGSLQTIVLSLP